MVFETKYYWYFAFIFSFIYLTRIINKKFKNVQILKKIPCPDAAYLIGQLIIFLDTPVNIWTRLRRYARNYYPIYLVYTLHLSAVNLISPEDIEIVLSSSVNIEKGFSYFMLDKWLKTGLLTSKGQKWQHRRKILTPTFHFHILKEFFNVFVKHTNELVKRFESECGKSSTNVVLIISECTLQSIAETAMGVQLDFKDDHQKNYINCIHRMGTFTTYRLLRPWLFNDFIYSLTAQGRREKENISVLHNFTKAVIKQRLQNFKKSQNSGNEDFPYKSYSAKKRLAMLDLLIKTMIENGDIDEDGIREEVDTFMFEGHDTTATSICFSLMLLACHQDAQDKVREETMQVLEKTDGELSFQAIQELQYLERFIKESLRLYPSVPFISRRSTEPFTTASGYYIPRDTEINVHIVDLHLNEKLWPDPNRFDPDRFLPEATKHRHPFAYLPFSAGPRNCIGQKYAMLEMKTVLSEIVRNFRLLPVDTPETISHVADMINRTTNGIKIKFEKL